MADIPVEPPSFIAKPNPSNERGGRLREIMDRVGVSLGIIKLHKAPLIDPAQVEKAREIDEILSDLRGIKEEFANHKDRELQAHVLAIINPMERHLNKVKNALADQGANLGAGEGWVLKAKAWTQLKGKPLHRATIIEHVIFHMREEVESSIKQDFRVIQVYLHHQMDAMRLTVEERKKLQDKLEEPLELLGNEIRNLMTIPAQVSLKALTSWKAEIDQKREKHQEAALELIDRHLPKKKSAS